MRTRLARILGIVAMLAAGAAAAHARLLGSTPAEGDNLTTAPKSLTLKFNESVRLAMLKLIVDGRSIPIAVDTSVAASSVVTVALPPLSAGLYAVRWSALTPSDGHVVKGGYSFMVR